ncbi:AMP-binding protein, partial [Vallitalea longa]|uniref:AMP-binding protein n=1 Tax=Vallitalea longa TaxID=2936439 RepID=UPI0024909ACC
EPIMEEFQGITQTSQVYLDNQVAQRNGQLSIVWDYIQDIFEEQTIEMMFRQYVEVIQSIINKKEYTFNIKEEDQNFINQYNDTQKEIEETTLVELIKRQMAKTPEKVAVKDKEEQLTYSELDRCSNQVAAYLIQEGVEKGDAVAVIASRDIA